MKEFKSPIVFMWQYLNRSVFDFIRGSRKYVTLPVPTTAGETIKLYTSAPETIVKFADVIDADFNLEVIPVNNKLGDKLYLIMNSTGPAFTVTSTGNLLFNDCGPSSPPSTYTGLNQNKVIIPFVFDGENFYGLDYC